MLRDWINLRCKTKIISIFSLKNILKKAFHCLLKAYKFLHWEQSTCVTINIFYFWLNYYFHRNVPFSFLNNHFRKFPFIITGSDKNIFMNWLMWRLPRKQDCLTFPLKVILNLLTFLMLICFHYAFFSDTWSTSCLLLFNSLIYFF